ncbi:MAG TPA: sporulation protein YunB [Candidatus Scatomorpha stercorigallinarum]|nr:sporulation protein YunB [Candidatus Scatomorpha stercorigallinarum]
MLRRRRPRRPVYLDLHLPPMRRATRWALIVLCVLTFLLYVGVRSVMYLRELSCDMVLSDAVDLMTLCVNDTINRTLAGRDYGYDYFVTIDRDESGAVTAIKANMARINALSSELLSDIVEAADRGELSLSIPIGNILGSSLLLGKGPDIPVDITLLTSSRVDFKNELSAAGINQTKHEMKLDVVVDIDVVLPWRTVSTQVVTEILIAETVIVGEVPQTYLDLER